MDDGYQKEVAYQREDDYTNEVACQMEDDHNNKKNCRNEDCKNDIGIQKLFPILEVPPIPGTVSDPEMREEMERSYKFALDWHHKKGKQISLGKCCA